MDTSISYGADALAVSGMATPYAILSPVTYCWRHAPARLASQVFAVADEGSSPRNPPMPVEPACPAAVMLPRISVMLGVSCLKASEVLIVNARMSCRLRAFGTKCGTAETVLLYIHELINRTGSDSKTYTYGLGKPCW